MTLRLILAILLSTSLTACAQTEIHSKHFFHGIPQGSPATNDLIMRDIYAMSSNDDTKFMSVIFSSRCKY